MDGAEAEGKVERVAQAVRKKHLRRRKTEIVLVHPQHRFDEQIADRDHVVLQMHRAFGIAGAAGGVTPKADIVFGVFSASSLSEALAIKFS